MANSNACLHTKTDWLRGIIHVETPKLTESAIAFSGQWEPLKIKDLEDEEEI